MIELKPCPFCGGEAEIYLSNDNPPAYGVKHSCHFGVDTYQIRIETKWKYTPEQAAELWNTRGDCVSSAAVSSEPENTGYWIVNYFSDGKPYFTCSKCQCICTNNPPPNYCEDCGSYNDDWEVSK